MARQFVSAHNYWINLEGNQQGAGPYEEVMAFLRRSRINHVLTSNPRISLPILEEFWANANCIQVGGSYVFQTRVLEQDIRFTEDDLRIIFDLGTVEQEGGDSRSTKYNAEIIRGAFRRMGFAGDFTSKTLFKKGLFGRWRYLAHVVLVGLSNKRTTFDTLNQEAQAQMVSLVFNKPYSFSKFFFEEFKKQITAEKKTRFLMYPRLVMMILYARFPALPTMDEPMVVATISKRGYDEFTKRYHNDPGAQDVQLFGAILNGNYPCPSDEAIAAYLGPQNEGEEEVAAAANIVPPQEQLHDVLVQEDVPGDDLDQQENMEVANEVIDPSADLEIPAEAHNANDLEMDELDVLIEGDKVVGKNEEVVTEVGAGASGTAETSDKGKTSIVVDAVVQGESSDRNSSDDSSESDIDPYRTHVLVPIGSRMIPVPVDKYKQLKKERKKKVSEDDPDFNPEKSDEETPLKRRKLESLTEKETSKDGEGSAGTELPQETEFQILQRLMSEQNKKQEDDIALVVDLANKLSRELREEVERNKLLKVQIDKAEFCVTKLDKKVTNIVEYLKSGKFNIPRDRMHAMFDNFMKWKAERDNQSGCKDDQLAEAPKDDDPNDDAAKDQVQPEVVV